MVVVSAKRSSKKLVLFVKSKDIIVRTIVTVKEKIHKAILRNYILNKTPYKKLGKISYELLNVQSSSYKYIKVWRCLEKITFLHQKKLKI
jgi:hypothetical protein